MKKIAEKKLYFIMMDPDPDPHIMARDEKHANPFGSGSKQSHYRRKRTPMSCKKAVARTMLIRKIVLAS